MELSEIFTTDRARQALSSRMLEKFWQKEKGLFLMMHQLFRLSESHCMRVTADLTRSEILESHETYPIL